jgi:poly-gamma-glutamate synthesis protein (capsule biosynthesis protein)
VEACEQRALPDSSFRILWAGDTLLGDASQSALDEHGYDWPFAQLSELLQGSDAAILNAEGPVTTIAEPYEPERSWTYNAQPEAAAAIATAGFTAVGLANNHSMDRGPAGLSDTIAHFEALESPPSGQASPPQTPSAPTSSRPPMAVSPSLDWVSTTARP